MLGRYLLVLGFNTKQYWVYDIDGDYYIDPPKDVLNLLDMNDQEKSEQIMESVLAQEPDWINETKYHYNGEI